MRKLFMALATLTALSACGADGEPVQPSLNAGIGVSNSGVHVGGSVGVRKGPLGIYLGL
jgi:hypothetical protein